jgi:chromosome segregation ATPase
MNDALGSIENLVERLAGQVEALVWERGEMLAEISRLRDRLAERDKEAVKTSHDMRAELEAAKMDALRFEQERIRVEARLNGLSDRLVALVSAGKRMGS